MRRLRCDAGIASGGDVNHAPGWRLTEACLPSTLRMLIWPEASRAQNSMAAVSALGSTVWVLILRLDSFSIPALPVNRYIVASRAVRSCSCPCCSGRASR
jgi:hypothetical protein